MDAGQIVVKEGTVGNEFFIIMAGLVGIHKLDGSNTNDSKDVSDLRATLTAV